MGINERPDQKDSVPPLNCPTGSLEDGDTFPAFLFPPYMVTAPWICWQELASANAACLMEIGQKKCPLESTHVQVK